MRTDRREAAAAAAAALLAAMPGPAQGQLRVVSYNSAHLLGDHAALASVFQALVDDDKPLFAVAPHVIVFQEVHAADVADLLDLVESTGVNYTLATYTNDDEDGAGGAQALLYRPDTVIEIPAGHADIYSGAGRRADRWQLRLLDYDSPDAVFYVYGAHLKASPGADNAAQRLAGAEAIRANADALPANRHILYAGDFNLYSNGEDAYAEFLSSGPAQALDPLGSGPWGGAAHALKHTQSPRFVAEGDLVGGGLDDRFDFQLPSSEWFDGEGLAIMSGMYRALGNDALHFDQAINAGTNFYYPGNAARSNALADVLYAASDHLPLIVEHQVPAVLCSAMAADFGRVIQGADFAVELEVCNAAEAIVPQGADELDVTVAASGGLSGTLAAAVPALAPPWVAMLPLDTSQAGPLAGAALVTSDSQGVQDGSALHFTSGTVLRPSNGSFAPDAEMDETTLALRLAPDSGVHEIAVAVHNYQYDAGQALLDIDAIEGLAAPFDLVSGIAPGIGAAPGIVVIAFDTAALSPGAYAAALVLHTSDEDLPGETQSQLLLTLTVDVTRGEACTADVTGDGQIDVQDLVAVILAWGGCARCAADITGDGQVDVQDLVAVVLAWGTCA